VGTAVHLAAEPTINSFNGRDSVELEVKDLQPAGSSVGESMVTNATSNIQHSTSNVEPQQASASFDVGR
jgi:hypothetical protein